MTALIDVLGTTWTIKDGSEAEYPLLKDIDGYADSSIRTIIVHNMDRYIGDTLAKRNMRKHKNQVIRHEIIHAFLCESGLDANTMGCDNWAINEEMVDWFAIQSPKIFKAFKDMDLIQEGAS